MATLQRNKYTQTEETLEDDLESALFHIKNAAYKAELAWDGWGSVTERAARLMQDLKAAVRGFVLVPPTYSQRGKSYNNILLTQIEKLFKIVHDFETEFLQCELCFLLTDGE